MDKKGAIEMSMTTIIVIVLGITLLILGLTFIRGIFTKIGGISDETFDKAQTMLTGLENVDQFLTVSPKRIEIEQGKDDVVSVIIANFGNQPITVTATATVRKNDPDLGCEFFEDSENLLIGSGKQQSLPLVVSDDDGALRRAGCNVIITGGPEGEDNVGSVIIEVVKSRGLV